MTAEEGREVSDRLLTQGIGARRAHATIAVPRHHHDDERSPFPGTGGQEHGNTPDQPLYGDVAALFLTGLPDPPLPAALVRDDGNAIFYAAQVNYVFGDPESGKTMIGLAAVAEALNKGHRAVFIDIDHNGMASVACRLLDMGADEKHLGDRTRFRYAEPEDSAHLTRIVADLRKWRPHVAVLDSIGELVPLMRLSSNSPDDFTVVHANVLKPLAKAGACVIAVDHPPKNPDNAASGPTGTAAKRRTVGGVSIRVKLDEPFTPGRGGSAWLSINKDRHGGLRQFCPPPVGRAEAPVGKFIIDPGNDLRWRVKAARGIEDIPPADQVDEGDLTALDELDPPPSSVRDVKDRLSWGSTKATKALAQWRSRNVPPEHGNA